MVREISAEQWEKEICLKPGVILLDIFTEWCPPCQRLKVILEDMAPKHPQVTFVKLNADLNMRLCEDFGIRAYPTILFFRDGKQVDMIEGLNAKAIEDKLQQLCSK